MAKKNATLPKNNQRNCSTDNTAKALGLAIVGAAMGEEIV